MVPRSLALLVASAALAAQPPATAPTEAAGNLYRGRLTGSWVSQLADPDPNRADEARRALIRMGRGAAGEAAAWTEADDPRVRAALLSVHVDLVGDLEELAPELARALVDPAPEVRAQAVLAFRAAPLGRPELVAPLQALRQDTDRAVREVVEHVLHDRGLAPPRHGMPPFDAEELAAVPPRYGGRTIDSWVASLCGPGHTDDASRVVGRLREPAFAALLRLNSLGRAPRCDEATWSLGVHARTSPRARRALREILRRRECGSAGGAARGLGLAGVAAADSLPDLLSAARDRGLGEGDCHDRRAAVDALVDVGVFDAGVEQTLLSLLDDEQPRVRAQAALALGSFGPPATAHVPRLVALLGDDAVADSAAAALERLGPLAADAEPALVAALEGAPEDEGEAFASALRGLWGTAGLLGRLESSDLNVRNTAFAVLPHLTQGVEFVPPALEDESSEIVGALCRFVASGDADLRKRTASVVSAFPADACDLAVCLRAHLLSEDERVRAAATEALVSVTGEAADYFPTPRRLTDCVIGQLGPVAADPRAAPAVAAVRARVQAADDRHELDRLGRSLWLDDADARAATVRRLAALRERQAEAVDALLRLLESGETDPGVRKAIAKARSAPRP